MSDVGVAQVRREVATDVTRLWAVVTDWPRHGRHVPATTVETRGESGVGQEILAVSRVAGFHADDPMEVTVWEPPVEGRPGRARLDKRGSILHGWAEITVRPLGPERAELVWREQISVPGADRRPLPVRFAERRLSRLMTHVMIERLTRKLAQEAEDEGRG